MPPPRLHKLTVSTTKSGPTIIPFEDGKCAPHASSYNTRNNLYLINFLGHITLETYPKIFTNTRQNEDTKQQLANAIVDKEKINLLTCRDLIKHER